MLFQPKPERLQSASRDVPDFMCIGAQKAGTTWLHAMLSQHPGIWRGPLKEHQFFNAWYCPGQAKQARNQITGDLDARIRRTRRRRDRERLHRLADPQTILTEQWYRQVFSHPSGRRKLKMDVTPSYSTLPEDGVRYARDLLGPVPIIFMIRDPLSREISQIRMNATRKMKRADLSSLTVDQWRNVAKHLGERGDYHSAVEHWENVFGQENIHYVAFGRIRTEPRKVLAEIEKRLGLRRHLYFFLRKPRWQGADLDVPEEIVERLKAKVAPQYDFLKSRFGEDFLAQTR